MWRLRYLLFEIRNLYYKTIYGCVAARLWLPKEFWPDSDTNIVIRLRESQGLTSKPAC